MRAARCNAARRRRAGRRDRSLLPRRTDPLQLVHLPFQPVGLALELVQLGLQLLVDLDRRGAVGPTGGSAVQLVELALQLVELGFDLLIRLTTGRAAVR